MKCNRNLLGASIAALLVAPAAGFAEEHEEDELEFDEAHIFFELNNTDGDLGIHALIDGEPWKKLQIKDASEKKLLNVNVRSRLRRQGLTEFFFESAEPTFDELEPEEFFDRFPPGIYEIEGVTLEGDEIVSETEITHLMPAPPIVNTFDFDDNCEDDDFVELSEPVIIGWHAVESTHPDLGEAGDITIYNYEVVVETEFEIDGEEFASVFSVILPPEVTSMTIPEEFIAQGDEFKYEILAREESFNQTATESCFVLE
ncbi:MAG: hypothetical protein KJO46_04495 [Gammaproteobacteria bacterium]|nr:hypothetical protein [Gammaproteobacteria bacterium]